MGFHIQGYIAMMGRGINPKTWKKMWINYKNKQIIDVYNGVAQFTNNQIAQVARVKMNLTKDTPAYVTLLDYVLAYAEQCNIFLSLPSTQVPVQILVVGQPLWHGTHFLPRVQGMVYGVHEPQAEEGGAGSCVGLWSRWTVA
ncbi:hypothetical protein, conserved in Apicomplexan species [Plasmodium knowlesi strain H]|uniref:Uncharacterized protein n=1 Tax=Plasmodium knowlesi (strain H) TaxID=5851 RepID=A0A1A7VCV4_PLAKH|nr:hypothetical protein, conserved in Apicomplexan species [Plasmodium knowlesi strain H]